MASLDIFFSSPLNLKNKITKIEHKKIFCSPSKFLKEISWHINIYLKYFMTPTKALRPSPPLPPPTLCFLLHTYLQFLNGQKQTSKQTKREKKIKKDLLVLKKQL